jgi:hypothetical protein
MSLIKQWWPAGSWVASAVDLVLIAFVKAINYRFVVKQLFDI